VVTRVHADDPEGTPVVYSLVGGTGLGLFEVRDDGTLVTTVPLDYEHPQLVGIKFNGGRGVKLKRK
jgi:hypothetical protein